MNAHGSLIKRALVFAGGVDGLDAFVGDLAIHKQICDYVHVLVFLKQVLVDDEIFEAEFM